jgi:predicted transcriptional regulator
MITIPTSILERSDVYSTGKMILAVILEQPVITSGAVARRLRMNRKTILNSMKQMRERGVIVTTRTGAKWRHDIA